jgi:Ice-binding-like/Putative Ig domain
MTRNGLHLAAGAGLAALLCGATPASAQTAPSLGSAQSFAVLAGSTVTSTGSSTVSGDLGVSPGSAVTGFPPGIVTSGTIHTADALALSAQNSVTTAYTALANQPCTSDLTGQDLGGKTLTAGVYCFSSSAQLTGTLRLDAQGNAAAVFIFQIGSTLTTASGSSVVLINGASPCNVFWQVGSSATLGTATSFVGNILALTTITVTTGATVSGRTLARNGAVTLDTNVVTASCAPFVPSCPAISLSPSSLPNGRVAVAYSQTFTGSGGTAPYTFAVTSGALPVGLTLTPSGILAGTPTIAGNPTVTIRVTDASGCTATLPYTIVVAAALPPPPVCPTITLAPTTLPNATPGVAYTQTITGSGGTAPYSFGVTAGALPAGMTLTPGGVLSGTPTASGIATFTIRGTDANGCFAEGSGTLTVTTAVPTMPEVFVVLLALGLIAAGYVRLRRRPRVA